ncbi:MAG: hypothetical protein C7B44_05735 [Sulfobacillus thermosulfidooxidans]|nr:MAG: hypothetical protein C7B44_05735 [Sulfobacillus thermosulfidooxidans]
MTPSPVSVADAWTRPLFLVWQPIWSPQPPTRPVGEILTRIRPPQPEWALSPLAWWRMAATLGPHRVAQLDQWVWQTVARHQIPGHWHINLWPHTVMTQAAWIAQQPTAGLVLETTEQWPWSARLWDTLHDVWMSRQGRVMLDDWTDNTVVPAYRGLHGLKIDQTVWHSELFTAAFISRWTDFVARCHDHGLIFIAEGIETPEQRDIALQCGCDGLQGFLWGQPQVWPQRTDDAEGFVIPQ